MSVVNVRPVMPADKAEWARMWERYLEFYETTRPPEVFESSWDWIMQGAHGMHSAIAEVDGRAVGIVNFLYHHWFWALERKSISTIYMSIPKCAAPGLGVPWLSMSSACRRERRRFDLLADC